MRANRAPWTIHITEAVINPKYKEVISVQGSQTSKTDGVLLNTIGWQMHYRHKPAIYYAPTEDNAASISMRMERMFQSVPELWEAIDHRRKSKFEMTVYGIDLKLGWGGSKTKVASYPAELVCFDELDRIEDIPGEGNPWQLTKIRRATYPNKKQLGASSPTLGMVEEFTHPETGLIHWRVQDDKLKLKSLSWQLWQEGTRGEFMLPCPHCGEYFAPKMKLIWFNQTGTPAQAAKEMHLRCPHCDSLIGQEHQDRMIDRGQVVCPGQTVENGELKGEPPDSSVASFHVHGLCSRWVTWAERTFEYVRLLHLGDEGRLQSYINTEMGECYWPKGEAPEWQTVMELSVGSGYRLRQVPAPVQRINVCVDVQKNRLVCTMGGWSKRRDQLEFWLLDYTELYGNTAEQEVWDALREAYLLYGIGDGNWTAYEMAIDSGYNPSKAGERASNVNRNIIYDFCLDNAKAVPTKGASRQLARPFRRTTVEYTRRGSRLKKNGLGLYELDTDFFKREVYARLRRPTDKPGRWHFPEFGHQPLAEKFFQELCSEQLTEDGKWLQVAENHVLDTIVMHLFLAEKQDLRKVLRESAGTQSPKTADSRPAPSSGRRKVQNDAPEGW